MQIKQQISLAMSSSSSSSSSSSFSLPPSSADVYDDTRDTDHELKNNNINPEESDSDSSISLNTRKRLHECSWNKEVARCTSEPNNDYQTTSLTLIYSFMQQNTMQIQNDGVVFGMNFNVCNLSMIKMLGSPMK
jgi:hypothetical protein